MTPPAVLITDDDAAFRETLGSVLEPLGVRALLAADGEEALRIVRREKVHLVLLDMHMPRLTGLETLRMLKQFKAVLPCILLSARLDEMIVNEARRAHAFSIMSKPVTRRQITGVVGRALRVTYNWPGRFETPSHDKRAHGFGPNQ
ncbi:MAG: response regulator [Pirellulales bacterium]|nr:response regulator [Pirellulales bacterium]